MAVRGSKGVILVLVIFALPSLTLLMDTASALSRGWRPDGSLTLVCLGLAASVALLSIGASAFSPLRRRVNERWAELLLLGGSLALCLGAGEVIFRRVAPPPPPPFHLSTPSHQIVMESQSWASSEASSVTRYTANSEGIRGPEPATTDTYRILCIGGSTTQCMNLDDQETWTHLLMDGLNAANPGDSIWVGSAGYPGYRTADHLAFVGTYGSLEQYDAALFLVGINDLIVGVSKNIIVRNLKSQRWREARARIAYPPYWTRLATYRYISRAVQVYAVRNNPFLEDGDPENIAKRRQRRAMAELVSTAPQVPEALDAFRSNLREIVRICQSRGVEPIFATQPTIWAEDLPPEFEKLLWMGEIEEGKKFLDVPSLRRHMDEFNEALLSVCAELGVTCIDLSSMDGRVEYFVDDCHFNEAGARAVADILVSALGDRLVLELARDNPDVHAIQQ